MREADNREGNPAFLREAIRLSVDNVQTGHGGPFGAVVVRDDEILGSGQNQVLRSNDPTAHAEILAIRGACAHLGRFSLAGCTIYTSCEPCPMCLSAILWARLDRVFYAASRHDAAEAGFDDSVFYRELAKPASQRTVPMIQDLVDEARGAFALWLKKEDRTTY